MRVPIMRLLVILLVSISILPPVALAAKYTEKTSEDWQFFHQRLITSASEVDSIEALALNLPVEFDAINLNTETYGTFIKNIAIPESMVHKQMGIKLPFVYSAATIFIDGKQIKAVGKIGTNTSEHETNLQTVIAPFTPTSSTVEIAIQISSFNHIRGGFSSAPLVGDWESIHQDYLAERYTTIFIGAVIVIVGIATLTIGLLSRYDKLFLTFGLFSIAIAIRQIFAVPFIYHELPISIDYVTATKMEYITTATSFILYAIFVYVLYNRLFSKYVLYFNVIVLLAVVILSIFTEPKFFQTAFFSVFPFMMFFVLYNIWIMFKALRLKLQLAKSLLLGVVFVLIGLIVDFLTGMGVINFQPIASLMIMFNVLLVLLSISTNYVKHMKKLKQMNIELDELVKERTVQLAAANKELIMLVNKDALTEIFNRRKFDEKISECFLLASENDEPLSFIMLDIDYFKRYNDRYGHLQGDQLLFHVAQTIKRSLPENVTLARYGGEEFVVILPGYTIKETESIAEKIRTTIEQEQIEHLDSDYKIITVSIGCSERTVDQIKDEHTLIKIADERLYMSKTQGRNQVTITSD